jgi:hypothetical protein
MGPEPVPQRFGGQHDVADGARRPGAGHQRADVGGGVRHWLTVAGRQREEIAPRAEDTRPAAARQWKYSSFAGARPGG